MTTHIEPNTLDLTAVSAPEPTTPASAPSASLSSAAATAGSPPLSTPPPATPPRTSAPRTARPIVVRAPAPDPTRHLGALELVDLLLRDRRAFLDRIDAATQPLATARALLVTCLVCTAAFGASLGAYRGGLQIAYAAIKLPLTVLLTASLVAPALTALGLATRAHDGRLDVAERLARDLVLVLAALALGGLVIAALTPLVLLGEMFGAAYHDLILALVSVCTVGGVLGLHLFVRGMARRGGHGRVLSSVGALVLFAVVGSQMSWSLRPFLVRPRTVDVPFVRAVEGSLLDSVDRSSDSARGIYTRELEEP